jgi:hypothetical protein
MLVLRLLSRLPRLPPAMHSPGLEVWRDINGEVAAYGGRAHNGHWLVVPRVGEFHIKPDDETVDASVEAGVSSGVVEDTFRRVVRPLAVQVRGDEVLHASAALSPTGVVAFCGVSGIGKSTLAYAMSLHGFRTFADDALVVNNSAAGVSVTPLPFLLSLRDPAATFLGARPGLHEPGPLPDYASLLTLCVLERAPVETPSVVRLSPAEAFTAVLQHAYCFTLAERQRTHAMVDAYLNLVSRVPVLRLRFSLSLPSLPSLVAKIEAAMEQLSR